MIITCNNCEKKFNVNSSLIPEEGRLLQCSSCNYSWFFKKKIINKPIESIKIIIPTENIVNNETKSESININNSENIELTGKQNKKDLKIQENLIYKDKTDEHKDIKTENETELVIDTVKNQKNLNILSLIIVFIITFIAIILILDTFQVNISKIVPNIEFILYNLYETINDIRLFLKDLI